MVQELFFEVVRKKQHIFCDAKDSATVLELKRMIEGVLKVPVSDQILVKFNEDGNYSNYSPLEDNRTIGESGFSAQNAKAQAPAQIGLMLRGESSIQVDELSFPPPIPDAMRQDHPQE